MSDVGGVGSRQAFRDDELEAMRRDEATTTTVNKARRDAGFKESDVSVRGDDRTLNEVLEHQKMHGGAAEAVAAATHAFELGEALQIGEHALHGLGRTPHVVVPLAAFAAGQYGMYEMEKEKLEKKDGATRDQLHAAILDRLDVPTGFKREATAKLGVDMRTQSAAVRISNAIAADNKPYAAMLQLHCDQGMNAARTMIEAGGRKDAFLAANPKIAERYAADAAFHNGFDALCWANDDSAKVGGDPNSYKAAIASLKNRDARYDAAHITYRM